MQWPLLSLTMFYAFTELIDETTLMKANPKEYFFSRRVVWNFLDLSSSVLIIAVGVIIFGKFELELPS